MGNRTTYQLRKGEKVCIMEDDDNLNITLIIASYIEMH